MGPTSLQQAGVVGGCAFLMGGGRCVNGACRLGDCPNGVHLPSGDLRTFSPHGSGGTAGWWHSPFDLWISTVEDMSWCISTRIRPAALAAGAVPRASGAKGAASWADAPVPQGVFIPHLLWDRLSCSWSHGCRSSAVRRVQL